MTEIESQADVHGHQPIDAVTERLNDPAVAASLVTVLDNVELLSTLVLGLSGLVERGDMIMDAVAEGVTDFKTARASQRAQGQPSMGELAEVAAQLSAATPLLKEFLDSPMASRGTVELLSLVSEAATEGAANARANQTEVTGVFSAAKTLKDPEVQKGLGFIIEIARSLGRRMG